VGVALPTFVDMEINQVLVNRNQIELDYGKYRLGMLVALASVVMLFTGLSSAYIVRAASAPDWLALPMPRFLWVSTIVLLVSSATLESARRSLKHDANRTYRRWLSMTAILGATFLITQLVVWRQLVRQGIYVASNPHSSFFYLLTAVHGLHLAGGLLALTYLLVRHRAIPAENRAKAKRLATTDAATIYWHFMDALWIYLFLLLFLWR